MARAYPYVSIDTSGEVFPINPVWVDISEYVLRIASIRRGRNNPLGRYEAGTVSLELDNSDGTWMPGNPRSPYATYIRPMTGILIAVKVGATQYPIFRGYIESWPPIFPGGLLSSTMVRCVDALKLFAQNYVDYSWSQESSHWRINSLLDVIGWPEANRTIITSGSDVRSGKSIVSAINIEQTPALRHMQDVAAAEDGAFFIDGGGLATFQGRHWRLGYSTSTDVQVTFGNDPTPGIAWELGDSVYSIIGQTTIPRGAGDPTEYPYINIDTSFDDSFLYNHAEITPSGGTVQSYEDADSIQTYGRRSYAASLLLTSDLEAADRAAWIVLQNKDPKLRIIRLITSGLYNDNMWIFVAILEISMKIAVIIRPPGSYAIRQEYWIDGIEYRNIDQNNFETVYTLQPATLSNSVWLLQDPVYGALDDTTRLAY